MGPETAEKGAEISVLPDTFSRFRTSNLVGVVRSSCRGIYLRFMSADLVGSYVTSVQWQRVPESNPCTGLERAVS